MAQIAEFFHSVTQKVDRDKIQGMNAVYQFNITGDDGGSWNVNVSGGQAVMAEGTAEGPNITLTMSAGDFGDLLSGKLSGQTAFLTGKLKIQGDMTLAMKLQSIFSLG